MVFNSLEFLIFIPIVIVLHYLLPVKHRWIMLLAASYYFYMSWDAKLIVLILMTTAISYAAAILVKRTDSVKIKRLWLVIALVASLGVLFFFKYFNFLSGSVTGLLSAIGLPCGEFTLKLILPVGISFYTFQTLSYVIDVYRGDIEPEYHFGYYALFVSFFPQLVAGPIERPGNLLPQLKAEHKFDKAVFTEGFGIALIGFFKKIAVADIAATYVNSIYNDAEGATGLGVLLATVLFAVQIYCDFSGYTDIAIGCAKMMGIKLMQNFNRPYSALTIKEFWSRWHISLSTWFRDYLYIPLGGNRRGVWRKRLNLMIVFLVSGLWHGAAWTFVIWGALHGAFQIIGELTSKPREALCRRARIDINSAGFRIYKQAVTFVLVCFAWIFFRANSISELGVLIGKLFTDWGGGISYIKETLAIMDLDLVMAAAMALSIYMLSRFDRKPLGEIFRSDDGAGTLSASYGYAFVIWIILAATMLIYAGDGASTFIYFQF